MSEDISGFGSQIRITASNTFPTGFTVTQFSEDADPFDFPAQDIASEAMGVNGDLITWGSASAIPMAVSVIPGSDDDANLAILLEANRPGRGKRRAADVISAIVSYPDGTTTTVTSGHIKNGMVARGLAGSGRQKTRVYLFAFENKVES